MNLYIFKYNNYYNRIVKKEDTLNGYGSPIHQLINCKDFSPNDGVNTVHIFGSVANNYDGSGDYLIVTDEYNEIISRWFIIETNFTRKGQWNLQLRRDLVVDYYDDIINADTFIEKATLKADNPLIFNNEQMSFNQIKTNEYLLYDKTKSSWIVGYIAPDAENIWKTYATFTETFSQPLLNYDELSAYNGNTIKVFQNATIVYNGINNANKLKEVFNFTIDKDSYSIESVDNSAGATILYGAQVANLSALNDIGNSIRKSTFSDASILANLKALENLESTDLTQFNGKIVLDNETGIFYRIKVSEGVEKRSEAYDSLVLTNTNIQNIKTQMLANIREIDYVSSNQPTSQYIPLVSARVSYTEQTLILEQISDKGLNVTIRSTARQAKDAPYYMFALKYSEDNLRLAIQMGTALGSNCYDIQLMPYCPVQDYFYSDGEEDIAQLEEGVDYEPILDNQTIVDFLFWCPFTNITFDINFDIPISINPGQKKVQSQCDMWRLCSPNGNGDFQFNVAKNNGVKTFNIDCTYRPINPYVHINPNFGGLYGYDANDFRGLILQGDFSIPLLSDQWIEYEISNKNFQNSFNRQIENLEVQQKVGRIQDVVGAITGVGTGAATGGLAGSLYAPGTGMGPGAAIGAGASLIGGVADIAINEALRNEALDYTIDQFGYQLGNIQARPQSIVKTGCLTYNNKKVPYLEYYTCTDVEKDALLNKIAYNGMTVMVIGKIKDYMNNSWSYNNITSKGYVKGQIIRMEDLEDEYHLLKEIANEINKGVYF